MKGNMKYRKNKRQSKMAWKIYRYQTGGTRSSLKKL